MIDILLKDVLFPSGILLFLFAAILPIIPPIKRSKSIRTISLSLALLANLLFFVLSIYVLFSGKELAYAGLRIMPSATMGFFIDYLAGFFIFTISIIATAATIYSFGYIEHYPYEKRKNMHLLLMNLFILSMYLVVASENTLTFLIFWELMSITSFFLVCFEYELEETRKAGTFYFIMAQLSTIFLIISFILLYNQSGSFDIAKAKHLSAAMSSLIFTCAFVGFGIKAGMIPFHKWLPYAHPAAPSNISALMSGLMIKVALYGLIRFLISVFPSYNLSWGVAILLFGVISAILGVIYALKEHDIKRLLAYHSIENIGIILMGIGLFVIFTFYKLPAIAAISLASAIFHILNHGLFKSLLFLVAGSVVTATHTKNIEELGGLIKKMPVTAILFLVGSISISTLPPFNGFVSEYLLFHSLFQASQISNPLIQVLLLLCLALLALTSALAAACFVKAFSMVFLAVPRSEHAIHAHEVNPSMLIGPSILALLCFVFGVFSFQIFSTIGNRIGHTFPVPNLAACVLIAGFFAVLVLVLLKIFASQKTRISETWGCGINFQNSKMEYTASGFSEPIITIFSFIYKPNKINERTFIDKFNAFFKEGNAEIHLIKFFEEYLYLPIANLVQKISQWLYKIQNEVALDSYILYEFVAIIVLIIIAGVIAL